MRDCYKILTTSSGQRALKKFPISVRKRLVEETQKLSENPYLGKQLEGKFKFLHSLNIRHNRSQYRVIYQILEKEKQIVILFAAPRENIYRRLKQLKVKPR